MSVELKLQADGLTYHDEQGRAVSLPVLAVGDTHFAAYEGFTLSRPHADEWRIEQRSGHTQHFQRLAPGQWRLALCALSDRNTNRLELRFNPADFGPAFDPFGTPPRPHTLIDSTGRQLRLQWSAQQQLTRVSQTWPLAPEQLLAPTPTSPSAQGIELARYQYAVDPLQAPGRPNSLPNLVGHTNPNGHSRQYDWKRHLLVGYTLADGQRYRNRYDQSDQTLEPSARVIESQNPDDQTALRFSYQGTTTWVEDRLGHTTGYASNERQDIVAVRDPLGHITHTPFDANGHPKGSTDALGQHLHYRHDAAGRLVQLPRPVSSRKTSLGMDHFRARHP